MVDAAHAPHFRFCDLLPRGAEELGADLVAQSTHKVANALSQGSLLLINRETFIEPLYEHVNDLGLVSTSFSYPILASIELAVRQLVEEGERIWTEAVFRAERLRRACRRIPGIGCFGDERGGRPGFAAFDPTRVTLHVGGTGSTGLEIERQLNRLRIYPEMATIDHLLFLVTPGTDDGDVDTLVQALTEIAGHAAARPASERSPAATAAGDGCYSTSGEVLTEASRARSDGCRKGIWRDGRGVPARLARDCSRRSDFV